MNFLAHLVLSGNQEGLRLGAMLGDFIRGRQALEAFDEDIRLGIMLHRHIDAWTDVQPEFCELRTGIPSPFRRYSGIIIDLAIDHVLARRWAAYSDVSLEAFDRGIREMLDRHDALLPDRLRQFMQYADRRGLFAAYREEAEILYSLRGIGTRLSRPNPLHRTHEIWDELLPRMSVAFGPLFERVQSDTAAWLKSKSTTTGS